MVRWPQSSLMCDDVRPKTPSACVSNMLSAIHNYFISYMENVRPLLLLRILTAVPFFLVITGKMEKRNYFFMKHILLNVKCKN